MLWLISTLFIKWAFDKSMLLVKDMIGKLGISDKGVPTSREAGEWSVPDILMFGRPKTNLSLILLTGFRSHGLHSFKRVNNRSLAL